MTPFAWFRWARRIVSLVVLVAVLGFVYVAFRVWWTAREESHPRSDVILVLGASQFNGRPSQVFAARLAHALTLYDDHVATRIVTVGGKQQGDNYTEAEAGRMWLETRGVPRGALVAVQKGSDTLSSLRAVNIVMQRNAWHSAVVVTDPWHELRSTTMAHDLGIDAHPSPDRTGPANHSRSTELHYVLRETVAYIYYEMFHSDSVHGSGAV